MNEARTAMISKITATLFSMIEANGGPKIKDPLKIWDNLQYLGTQINVLGSDPVMILRLDVKRMLAFIADPMAEMTYEITKGTDNLGEYAIANAVFKWSDGGYGRGYAKRYLSQIFPTESMTSEERSSVWEKAVISSAMSEAYTNAGIGLEFRVDKFDVAFEKQEVGEATALQERKTEAKNSNAAGGVNRSEAFPSLPSNNEIKEQKAAKRTANNSVATGAVRQMVNAAAKVQKDAAPIPEKNPAPEKVETAAAEPKASPASAAKELSVDLEAAKAVVASVGPYAGNALGMILTKAPRSLLFFVNQSTVPENEKAAARALVESDPKLAAMLKK